MTSCCRRIAGQGRRWAVGSFVVTIMGATPWLPPRQSAPRCRRWQNHLRKGGPRQLRRWGWTCIAWERTAMPGRDGRGHRWGQGHYGTLRRGILIPKFFQGGYHFLEVIGEARKSRSGHSRCKAGAPPPSASAASRRCPRLWDPRHRFASIMSPGSATPHAAWR